MVSLMDEVAKSLGVEPKLVERLVEVMAGEEAKTRRSRYSRYSTYIMWKCG